MRDLEREALRLADTNIPAEVASKARIYQSRLDALEQSHSNSWFGEHSNTYYNDFKAPPAGGSFDVEWGFIRGYSGSRNRDWRTYSREDVRAFAFENIGEQIFYDFHTLAEQLNDQFSAVRDQALDVLERLASQRNTKSIARYAKRVEEEIKPYDISDYINARIKSSPSMTRDSEEIAKGQIVPAHVQYMAPIKSLEVNKRLARELANTLRNAIQSETLGQGGSTALDSGAGTRIFIGHGRSEQWRVLKDFIRDRLRLDFDEFNRVSVAGITNQERLSEMLDRCGFAFLVMTAEDERGDGSLHARQNVIHEVGLFQGRLDWRRAIILLEEGCEEFSNVAGLGQIRFSKGNISSCFEQVRSVLEREGLLAAG